MRLSKRLFAYIVNALQVITAIAYCIFAIFFDRYELRNVGVGVSYAAYLILVTVICQIANLIIWRTVRETPFEVRLLRSTVSISLFATIVFVWLGQHYSYWGSTHLR